MVIFLGVSFCFFIAIIRVKEAKYAIYSYLLVSNQSIQPETLHPGATSSRKIIPCISAVYVYGPKRLFTDFSSTPIPS